MTTIRSVAVLVAASVVMGAAAQEPAKLSAQDLLDIRQLIDGYSHILDNCTNNGNTYADLFTPDATFGVSSEWGTGVKVWFRGREQLRVAGGGGTDACRPPPLHQAYHLVISPVIRPAPGGAKAISTLLTITNKTTRQGDIVHWEGGYEDTFEKLGLTVLPASSGARQGTGAATIASLTAADFFSPTKVWDVHLAMTAEAWQAMQPRYGSSGGGSRFLGPKAAATESRRARASSSTMCPPRCSLAAGPFATSPSATRDSSDSPRRPASGVESASQPQSRRAGAIDPGRLR